jgi:DNA repair exonuclease SbcCD ATPase subunit
MVCYKSEIGLALQRMVESYNILLLMQFEGFYTEENQLKREYSEKVRELDDRLKEINALKDQLKNEQFMMQQLIASKENESKRYQSDVAFLEIKLTELKNFINGQKMNEDPRNEERAKNARQKILDQIAAADEDSSSLGSDSSDPEIQALRLQAFGSVVEDYQSVKVARN